MNQYAARSTAPATKGRGNAKSAGTGDMPIPGLVTSRRQHRPVKPRVVEEPKKPVVSAPGTGRKASRKHWSPSPKPRRSPSPKPRRSPSPKRERSPSAKAAARSPRSSSSDRERELAEPPAAARDARDPGSASAAPVLEEERREERKEDKKVERPPQDSGAEPLKERVAQRREREEEDRQRRKEQEERWKKMQMEREARAVEEARAIEELKKQAQSREQARKKNLAGMFALDDDLEEEVQRKQDVPKRQALSLAKPQDLLASADPAPARPPPDGDKDAVHLRASLADPATARMHNPGDVARQFQLLAEMKRKYRGKEFGGPEERGSRRRSRTRSRSRRRRKSRSRSGSRAKKYDSIWIRSGK
mmetsp:Transcript_45908/g.109339  ORF Transcript_45908/g.109339 Transcript_45908/m.109339 type:complete len:362 (+) Transcript_45908:93-1178(+)